MKQGLQTREHGQHAVLIRVPVGLHLKKPTKYADITIDSSMVLKPSISPLIPISVPCSPFPTISNIMPSINAHVFPKTVNMIESSKILVILKRVLLKFL